MDKTALVEAEIELGRTIIRALEQSGIPIDLAAWFQDERLDWRLVVSSPTISTRGLKPVFQAIQEILVELGADDLSLDDVTASSPSDTVVQNLKNYVRTGDELQTIKLRDVDLGQKSFRSVVVYRSQGGRSPGRWLEMDSRVRAKASGQIGSIWSREDTPKGTRYLVRHYLPIKDQLLKNGAYAHPDEQVYDADELDFLYAIRPGGWPNKPPLMKQSAREAARTG